MIYIPYSHIKDAKDGDTIFLPFENETTQYTISQSNPNPLVQSKMSFEKHLKEVVDVFKKQPKWCTQEGSQQSLIENKVIEPNKRELIVKGYNFLADTYKHGPNGFHFEEK